MKAASVLVLFVAAIAMAACERKHSEVQPTAEPSSATAPGATSEPHSHEPVKAPPAPSATASSQNPVQAEMQVLHGAARDWVTAIAQNQLELIPAGIAKVHAARTVTERALEKGEYKLPKAGADLEQFKKEDEAFHEELVKLVRASKSKDLPAATKQLGTVLVGCTNCHVKYRF
jgi:hypothetical protein